MLLAGPGCIAVKTSAGSNGVASVMAAMSSIALQVEVIPDQVDSCQWDADDFFSLGTTERSHRFT